jgi:hypothetical protein
MGTQKLPIADANVGGVFGGELATSPSVLAIHEKFRVLAKAWHDLKTAESEISRLNGYKNLSKPMRDDRTRHARVAGEARRTLDSVLRVAA